MTMLLLLARFAMDSFSYNQMFLGRTSIDQQVSLELPNRENKPGISSLVSTGLKTELTNESHNPVIRSINRDQRPVHR